jgi:hypothetical protein
MSPEGHQVAGTPSKRAKSHGLGRAGIFRKMQYIQCQDRMRMATITMAPSISTQYDRYRVYFVTKSFLSDPSKTMEINQSLTRAQTALRGATYSRQGRAVYIQLMAAPRSPPPLRATSSGFLPLLIFCQ